MKRLTGFLLVVTGLVWVVALTAHAAAADTPTLGDKVVAYCKAHLDEKVGNGECAGLAAQALSAAGARRRAGPDFPHEGDYVWGKQVYLIESSPAGPKETGKLSNVRPGDIMQYRDVRFGEKGGFKHHTAVVAEVFPEKGTIKVYQQNVGGKRFVTEGEPRLNHLAEGWIRIYRPIPEPR